MKVFKFGGASVKNAEAVKNVGEVIQNYPNESIMIIVSAMGKTTNALEEIVDAYWSNTSNCSGKISSLKQFHDEICNNLFPPKHNIFKIIDQRFDLLTKTVSTETSDNFDFEYDQIVSQGEVLSTLIISAYLEEIGLKSKWYDARKIVRTNHKYREGEVDWNKTVDNMVELKTYLTTAGNIAISQGFIGHTEEGFTTTLGREGSDYSAAIFAYGLDAESVTIWKDVPGLLNADPKYFDDTIKIDKISFKEAIELSYYGASVIHPKTIKPLQNKDISLYVKSFIHPTEEGTVIQSCIESDHLVPSYIFKKNQVLLSLSPKDFSFINEENLSRIFNVFSIHGIRINVMQNSAINFSVCIDKTNKLEGLLEDLKEKYLVRYNSGLELVTIRHHNDEIVKELVNNRPVFLTQETRNTIRILIE